MHDIVNEDVMKMNVDINDIKADETRRCCCIAFILDSFLDIYFLRLDGYYSVSPPAGFLSLTWDFPVEFQWGFAFYKLYFM